MNWNDRPEVQKGNIGERLVDEYLLRQGIVPYRPIVKQAHPFDRLCASKDKKHLYVAEVKAKPKRELYPDTGIDWRHYRGYCEIAMTHNIDVFIYFVDEVMKAIYGGELIRHLSLERKVRHNGSYLDYPWTQRGIIYFPLEAMSRIATLTDEQCAELAELRRSNFKKWQNDFEF